jgi:hypothetical protein
MLECPGDEVRSPVRHAPLTTLFDAPVGDYTAPGGGRAHQACVSILRMLTLLTFPTSATLATAASTTTTSYPRPLHAAPIRQNAPQAEAALYLYLHRAIK